MPYEDKPGEGMMFVNTKRTNDRQPVMNGYLVGANGERIQFAVWPVTDRETGEPKLTKHGARYFKIKREIPRDQQGNHQSEGRPYPDDDIPF